MTCVVGTGSQLTIQGLWVRLALPAQLQKHRLLQLLDWCLDKTASLSSYLHDDNYV